MQHLHFSYGVSWKIGLAAMAEEASSAVARMDFILLRIKI
jgi:hypothetical protein